MYTYVPYFFYMQLVIFFFFNTLTKNYFLKNYMKILVFDTETTGFIDKKNPSTQGQPFIIQFAGIL